MNITYLLILLVVLVQAVYWVRRAIIETKEWHLIPTAIFLGGLLIMFVVSFLGQSGTPITKVFPQGSFEIEQTPYRVIVRADAQERTFTDARTVVQATQAGPTSVRLTYYVNAWGGVHESAGSTNAPKMELLFEGDGKPEQSPTK